MAKTAACGIVQKSQSDINPDEQEAYSQDWLTVERAMYATSLLIAVVMRFYAIGSWPLHSVEVVNAWPAWQAATGVHIPGSPLPGSALLYSFHTALFAILGAGDVVARLAPACFGALMTLVPWWWRSFAGRYVAFSFSLLIAIDPWLVRFSRLADGAILGTFCGLVVLTGLINLVLLAGGYPGCRGRRLSPSGDDTDSVAQARMHRLRFRWSAIIAASSGLLLASGAVGWSYVVVLLLFVAGYYHELKETFVRRISLIAWFGGALILGSTAWLARPEGLGLVSVGLGNWMSGILPGATVVPVAGTGYELSWTWLRLISEQPMMLLAGLGGLVFLAVDTGRETSCNGR